MEQKNMTLTGIEDNPMYKLVKQLRMQCYTQNSTNSEIITESPIEDTEDTLFCARTFDGFSCWDDTPAGAVAFQECPNFIVGFDPTRIVYKNCSENGTWFRHPETNRAWTNYTTCVDMEDLHFRMFVNEIYIGGYAISIVALVLSLIIFTYFRSLRCTRIRIHMHLFSSFTINNIFWIIWYRTVVNNASVVMQNKVWCQILHVVTHYLMITSYSWMFCESLYLHIALVVVFIKDKLVLKFLVIIGWGVSFLIVIVYSTVRFFIPGGTERCWIEQSETMWIIIVPVALSLFASLLFLVNVVRLLITKLRPDPNQGSYVATRKAARAAFLLIPLFGLHFILIPVRPPTKTPGEHFYQIFSAIIISLQGACLSVLFCFTNSDVVAAIKLQYARYVNTNVDIPMTDSANKKWSSVEDLAPNIFSLMREEALQDSRTLKPYLVLLKEERYNFYQNNFCFYIFTYYFNLGLY